MIASLAGSSQINRATVVFDQLPGFEELVTYNCVTSTLFWKRVGISESRYEPFPFLEWARIGKSVTDILQRVRVNIVDRRASIVASSVFDACEQCHVARARFVAAVRGNRNDVRVIASSCGSTGDRMSVGTGSVGRGRGAIEQIRGGEVG